METNTDKSASVVGHEMDVRQGYPQPVEEQPEVTPENEDATVSSDAPEGDPEAPESTNVEDRGLTTPEEQKAATERLKQQNARQAKLLASLGIDPLSDIAEQLESGLITPDMVVNHLSAKNRPQQPTMPEAPADPVSQAEQEYEAAKKACQEEGQQHGQISFETNQRYIDAAIRLQDVKGNAITSKFAAEQQAQQANQAVERVLTVARNSPYYQNLDESIREKSDYVHVALTNVIAGQEAAQLGLNPNSLTPQQYEYFAQKASAYLGELADGLVKSGQRPKAVQAPQEQPSNMPTPAGAGGQGAPLVNPFAGVNHTNHKDAARQYMAGNR